MNGSNKSRKGKYGMKALLILKKFGWFIAGGLLMLWAMIISPALAVFGVGVFLCVVGLAKGTPSPRENTFFK
jgi:hypothetical protein